MEKRQTLAVITHTFSSFVENDYTILNKQFNVERVEFHSLKDIFKLFNAIRHTDISLSWFVDIWSFFAVIFSKVCGKPSVVIAGGYDVACEPDIAYGQFNRSYLRRLWAKFVLKHADHILSVSDFTKMEVNKCVKTKRLKTVYNGVNIDKFKPHRPKTTTIITVSSDASVIALKGLETFVEVAKRCLSYRFIILGCSKQDKAKLVRYGIPRNLTILGKQTQNELLRFYQEAVVYCQLSYRESFGMAMAEAMACGCIPVATDRGALQEVVGDVGIIVPYNSVNDTVEGIKLAVTMSPENARKHIADNFTMDIRERELLHVFDFLLRDKGTRIRMQKCVKVADVQPNSRVLDLGCGNKVLKALLPTDIEYTGIDLSKDADITYDIEQGLPQELKTNRYDTIFLNECIEHIEGFKSLVSECKSVLAEHGKIIITTPSNIRVLLFGDEDKDHIHCFRKTNMQHLAKHTGLRIESICGTYISTPTIRGVGAIVRTNQTLYSDVLIYKLATKQ